MNGGCVLGDQNDRLCSAWIYLKARHKPGKMDHAVANYAQSRVRPAPVTSATLHVAEAYWCVLYLRRTWAQEVHTNAVWHLYIGSLTAYYTCIYVYNNAERLNGDLRFPGLQTYPPRSTAATYYLVMIGV
jgi:hypothetical protein